MLDSKSDDDIPTAAAAVVVADPPLAVVVAADPPLANMIEYEEIPKLLFVDMQQEDEEKVAAAVTKLADLVNTSNANWKVNNDQALSVGAIAIILLLMQKWHYNRSIEFHGCCVLARLTYFNGKARPQQHNHLNRHPIFTNDEGAPVAFGTLAPHLMYCGRNLRRYCGQQFKGEQCRSCVRLQMSPDASVLVARATAAAVSIIKSGGIETIMAAMKSFPDDGNIQSAGCTAIGNAFYFHGTKTWSRKGIVDCTNLTIDKAMARFGHKLNGIELVVQVMKKFQNDASVQITGCQVLQQLSTKQVLRDALKKGGALSAVGEATEKHDGNSLQSAANAFFKNMLGGNN